MLLALQSLRAKAWGMWTAEGPGPGEHTAPPIASTRIPSGLDPPTGTGAQGRRGPACPCPAFPATCTTSCSGEDWGMVWATVFFFKLRKLCTLKPKGHAQVPNNRFASTRICPRAVHALRW